MPVNYFQMEDVNNNRIPFHEYVAYRRVYLGPPLPVESPPMFSEWFLLLILHPILLNCAWILLSIYLSIFFPVSIFDAPCHDDALSRFFGEDPTNLDIFPAIHDRDALLVPFRAMGSMFCCLFFEDGYDECSSKPLVDFADATYGPIWRMCVNMVIGLCRGFLECPFIAAVFLSCSLIVVVYLKRFH